MPRFRAGENEFCSAAIPPCRTAVSQIAESSHRQRHLRRRLSVFDVCTSQKCPKNPTHGSALFDHLVSERVSVLHQAGLIRSRVMRR